MPSPWVRKQANDLDRRLQRHEDEPDLSIRHDDIENIIETRQPCRACGLTFDEVASRQSPEVLRALGVKTGGN